MNDTFTKTPGTTDRGKDYEDLNVASIVLKLVTDDHIHDFTLSSNDKEFGSFDDIVFESKSGELVEQYALQLKYSNHSGSLTSEHLTGENGKFALSKYLHSYEKIGHLHDSCKFILFTNRKVNNWDGKKLFFEKQGFSVQLSKENVIPCINNSKASGSCYKFTRIQSTISNVLSAEQQRYKNFFEKFYLYTNQANVVQLEASVSRRFEDIFCCSDAAFKRYKEFISKWSKREGTKEKLNKTQMKRIFAFCVLLPSIQPVVFEPVNRKMKLLQRAISMFQVTVFKKTACTIVSKIWTDRKIELKDRLEEVNQIRKKYELNLDYIKNISELDENNCTKLLWLLEICPLIVTESRSSYVIIQLCNKEKFVLLRNGSNEDQLQDLSIFQSLADLSPSSDVYKMITRTFKYSLQGKEESLLETVLEENKDFARNISTDDLLLMSEKTHLVGGGREPLPVPYISRYLSRNILDINYLKKIDDDTVVVIDFLCRNDDISQHIRNFNLIEINDHLTQKKASSIKSESTNSFTKIHRQAGLTASTAGPDLYITQEECSKEDFKTICKLKYGAERYHHLRATEDGKIEWIRSLSSIDDLQPFHLVLGSTKESRLWNSYNKINLIIGEPGMGKSVLTRNLKNNISSIFWTIIFHTEDIFSLFKFLDGQRLKQNLFVEYLLRVKYANLKSFDKKILQMLMQENHVAYIWDAIDEISTHDLDLITDIILDLSKTNVNQWITCRSHLKNYLERKFNVFSQNIYQFTEEQQFLYIQERLIKNHQDDLQSEIKRIQNLIVHHEILGIPLQIFILTELFRENADKYSNLSKDTFNITDLYEYFMDEKFNIYYRKCFLEITGQNREQILSDHRRNRFTYYQRAALKALVGSLLAEFYDCEEFLNEIQQGGDPVGVITAVTDDITPHFIHKSFAEYFVALYFVKHCNSINKLQNTIFKNTLQNIRFFFDLLMARNSPANVAVLYKNIYTLQEFGDDLAHCKDLGGRNVLQIACSWGQQYPSFPVSYEDPTYIIDTSSETNYTVSKEDPKYVEMLLYLLGKCDVSEKDELFSYTSLVYAQETKCLFAKAVIMQNQDQQISTFSDDYSMASILYYSAKFGYTNFIGLYRTFPFIKTQDGSTLLHLSICQEEFFLELLKISAYRTTINDRDLYGLTAVAKACQQGQYAVVKHLLSCDASINISSNNGRTPLHYACQFGHYDIAYLLLEAGIDVNIKDHNLWTSVHLACCNGHFEVASLLLDKGADVNLANNDDCTPLHSACINGYDKVIELLIRFGGDAHISQKIYNTKHIAWTPLHLASWHGHDKVVELLLKIGTDSNITTKLSRTPLHYACEKGHDKVVRLLCEHGTAVNVVTDEGWTPLHFACNNGYYNIVKELISAGSLLNIPENEGLTPLHVSAYKGQTKIAKLLIENDAHILETASGDGRRPLHYASQFGHHQTVKLLTKYHCNVNSADNKGLTPLHLSCMEKQDKVIRILIDCKADVNAVTQKQKTALHYACKYGDEEAVKLLIIYQASIDAADSKGITPLHLACYNGQEKIVQWLITAQVDLNNASKNGWTALHHVSHTGNMKIAKTLISSGADIQAKLIDNGWTALYVASLNGHNQIVHLLLKCGASIDGSTNTGRTPLHAASENNHFRVAWSLIDLRANIDSCDNSNWTPLHVASKEGHLEIGQLLVNSGANINAATENGWTPLHLTCIYGNSKMCEQLLKYPEIVDVEAVDNEKKTPFYLACQHGHEIICNMLLAADAKNFVSAVDGSTVLHAACRHGHTKIVKILLKRMQDINVRDTKGSTPLHYACESGHQEVANVLISNHADVNARDVNDKTPLHNACDKGYKEVVELLLGSGAKIKASTTWGATPVFLASRNNHRAVVDLMNNRPKEDECCIFI